MTYKTTFFSLCLLACLVFYSLTIYYWGRSDEHEIMQERINKILINTPITYIEYPSDTLTKQNIEAEIKRAKIKFPSVVYKQIMLETGNLNCKDCSLSKNNLFGFQRDSTGYLCFETWQLSIAKYKFWQERNWDSTKYKNYYECLEKCWGADSLYVKHLMQF